MMFFYKILPFLLFNKLNKAFLKIVNNNVFIKTNMFYIIENKKNIKYEDNEDYYIKNNNFLQDKKLISISPGGLYGFYFLGIGKFLKENYDLKDFIFTGSSAGSWSSLFMTYKGDTKYIIETIFCKNISNIDSIIELEYSLKYKILNNFNDDDFDFKKLFIGVTSIKNFNIVTNIFTDFCHLEDAINCCIASSHIPYITGNGFTNKYHNMYSFDGGLSPYPYLNISKPVLHITPKIFKEGQKKPKTILRKICDIKDTTTTLLNNKKFNFIKLYEEGYQDAKNNKLFLDKIFIS